MNVASNRFVNSHVLVVSYHYIRSRSGILFPGIHPVTYDDFIHHIDYIKSHLAIISPCEFENSINGFCMDTPAALLTFDDGLRDHLYAAKELERYGLRGAFFICSRPSLERKALPVHKLHWLRAHTPPDDFYEGFFSLLPSQWQDLLLSPSIEIKNAAADQYHFDSPPTQVLKYLLNFILPYECVDQICTNMLSMHGLDEDRFCRETYLTIEEIQSLADQGHLIGCHGHLHKPFSQFNVNELLADIAENKKFLQDVAGANAEWLAYPYGGEWSLPADTTSFTLDAGIRLAFTYERGWNTKNVPSDRLKRIDCTEIKKFI